MNAVRNILFFAFLFIVPIDRIAYSEVLSMVYAIANPDEIDEQNITVAGVFRFFTTDGLVYLNKESFHNRIEINAFSAEFCNMDEHLAAWLAEAEGEYVALQGVFHEGSLYVAGSIRSVSSVQILSGDSKGAELAIEGERCVEAEL